MHKCAEYFYKSKVPVPPSLEKLLKYYEETWLSEGYETPEDEADYKAYGREILKEFHSKNSKGYKIPIALEKGFSVDVDGVTLKGYLDRVDLLPDGKIEIIDYKTDKELFTKEYLKNNLQLTLYQYAVSKIWSLPVGDLALYHLRTNTKCSAGVRAQEELDNAKSIILEVAENIEKGKFEAKENHYCPCDFAFGCSYYAHLYKKEEKTKITPQDEEMPKIVDEYALAKENVKEMEQKIANLRADIISYCEKNGLKRVYGKNNEATLGISQRFAYEEGNVKEILKDTEFIDAVLAVDQTKLAKMLSEGKFPKELAEKIEEQKRQKAQVKQLYIRKSKNNKEL